MGISTRLTFHEIHSLGSFGVAEPLALPLPFEIMEGVMIEDVSGWLTDKTLSWVSKQIGINQTESLKNTQFALVHRYNPTSGIRGTKEDQDSTKLVRRLIELTHIIRPMRQNTSIIHGEQTEDGERTVTGFETPHEIEVPEVQKLYHLRDKDVLLLKMLSTAFLEAMQGNAMKFRSSVFYHSAGRLVGHGNARYLLWCSAIEALYTSHTRGNQGKRVATNRIRAFLGPETPIYEPGDVPDLILEQPKLTVDEVVEAVYDVRNYIAHGEVIPDKYFVTPMRDGIDGDVSTIEVLGEAASFIVRESLLRILKNNLLEHFRDGTTANAYFSRRGAG
jgi:hypothetical protein